MSFSRALTAFLPLALVTAGAAQSVTLRFMPPVGKPMRYAVVNKMTQSFPGMGAPMTTTQNIPITMTALSRKGGDTTVQSKIGTVGIVVPAGSPMAGMKDAMVKAASNKTTTIVVDAFGKPKSMATAGATSQIQMGGVQGVAFPAKAIKPGDTWTTELDMSKMAPGGGAGGVKMSGRIPMRYTLKSVGTVGGRKVATLGLVIDGAASMNAMGQPMTLKMKGTGSMRVDAATGSVVDSHIVMDTSTSMGARGSFGQRTDVTMKAL